MVHFASIFGNRISIEILCDDIKMLPFLYTLFRMWPLLATISKLCTSLTVATKIVATSCTGYKNCVLHMIKPMVLCTTDRIWLVCILLKNMSECPAITCLIQNHCVPVVSICCSPHQPEKPVGWPHIARCPCSLKYSIQISKWMEGLRVGLIDAPNLVKVVQLDHFGPFSIRIGTKCTKVSECIQSWCSVPKKCNLVHVGTNWTSQTGWKTWNRHTRVIGGRQKTTVSMTFCSSSYLSSIILPPFRIMCTTWSDVKFRIMCTEM